MPANSIVFYWDTCIFVAWLKNETSRKPGELEGTIDCVEKFKRREISLMTSALTLIEMTAVKIPAGVETLLEETMQRSNFTTVSVDIRVAKLARDLRNHYLLRPTEYSGLTLSLPDSIHLATAILYHANEFHTFDGEGSARKNSLGLLPLDGDVAGHKLKIRRPPNDQQRVLFDSSEVGDALP
jgi:predicted nucleic acid-binding protein